MLSNIHSIYSIEAVGALKIDPGYRPLKSGLGVSDNPSKPVQSKSFADVMQQHGQQATQEELNRRFKEIQMQGDRLARSMTIRELKAYRMMVKRFLEDTVRRGWASKNREAGTVAAVEGAISSLMKWMLRCWRWQTNCWRRSKAKSSCCKRSARSAAC